MKTNLYILCTADKLEYVVGLGTSFEELSIATGIPRLTLYSAYSRKSLVYYRYKVEKVNVVEPQDMFNVDDYNRYCKRNKLKPSSARSLEKFRQFCFGG